MPLSRLFVAGAFAISVSITGALHAISVEGPWVIFFESRSTEFDELDRTILQNVADAWKSWPKGAPHLEIMGHTDRSGTASNNLKLSCARAKAVLEDLVVRGLSRDQLVATGWGENEPLLLTEDGVAEIQNRRVEIFYMSDKNKELPAGVVHC
jgi:OmpA-OmpF porin, OOP family